VLFLCLQVCAPTGAGKTNIAMISILHEVNTHFIFSLPWKYGSFLSFEILFYFFSPLNDITRRKNVDVRAICFVYLLLYSLNLHLPYNLIFNSFLLYSSPCCFSANYMWQFWLYASQSCRWMWSYVKSLALFYRFYPHSSFAIHFLQFSFIGKNPSPTSDR